MTQLNAIGLMLMTCAALEARDVQDTEANVVIEIPFRAENTYANPFLDVIMDVVFTDPEGVEKTVPAFWAGGERWQVRYASPVTGIHRYRSRCSDADDAGLHGVAGRIEVRPYTGDNPLYRHVLFRWPRTTGILPMPTARPFSGSGIPGGNVLPNG